MQLSVKALKLMQSASLWSNSERQLVNNLLQAQLNMDDSMNENTWYMYVCLCVLV